MVDCRRPGGRVRKADLESAVVGEKEFGVYKARWVTMRWQRDCPLKLPSPSAALQPTLAATRPLPPLRQDRSAGGTN
jgi:hypothetical protein